MQAEYEAMLQSDSVGHKAASCSKDVRKKLQDVFDRKNLEEYLHDENYLVRYAVAEQGYGLSELVNDPEAIVRRQVAVHGFGLEQLLKDESEWVRAVVAGWGYGLDELSKDPNEHVRHIAQEEMRRRENQINKETPLQCGKKESLSHKILKARHTDKQPYFAPSTDERMIL